MSDTSGEMLVEMWLAIKPYIDKKERLDAALAYLRASENFVNLEQAREDAKGSDSTLDTALAELLGDSEEEIEEDQDEDY